MRIAIDARELAGQPTGVGRYLSEILRAWGGMPETADHEFVFCAPGRIADDALPRGGLRGHVEVEPGGGTRWEQRALPRLARRAKADVLFCPGYSGPIFGGPPLVVAIHDVSFAARPEWYRWREGLRRRLITRACARRAARVLTISEFSRREIAEHFGVPRGKIEVFYPGVPRLAENRDLSTDEPVAQRFSAAHATHLILYVGSIFNRRHVPETIKAFDRLARRLPQARLAIVGDNRTFPRIELEPFVRHPDRVAVRAYLPDSALRDLYRQARAFVFLSEYEGFGFTPVEALASGVPIVVLDTPVAREVYRDAALYVPAPDPRLIEPALERALTDEAERARVLAAAPAVLARYSWTACARGVLRVLESAGSQEPAG